MAEGGGGKRSARERMRSPPAASAMKSGIGAWFSRWRRSPRAVSNSHPSDGAALASGSSQSFEPTVFDHYEHNTDRADTPPAQERQAQAAGQPGGAAVAAEPEQVETALIVGAGPRWALALADALASHGMKVAFAGAHGPRLELLAERLRSTGCPSAAYACDVTQEVAVQALFKTLSEGLGAPDLVVWAQPASRLGPALDQPETALEGAWRQHGLAALLVAREAARTMVARGRGTVVLAESLLNRVGPEDLFNANLGQFSPRVLVQELARQWWGQGVHVCQLIADADFEHRPQGRAGTRVGAVPQCELEEVAQAVLQLHLQPRSAWSSELRLRPWNAPFR